jgi:hypothetical protein
MASNRQDAPISRTLGSRARLGSRTADSTKTPTGTDPTAKRKFLSLIFENVWLDQDRVVAVQPKPSFLSFFQSRRAQPAGTAGVTYGSDGGPSRVCCLED